MSVLDDGLGGFLVITLLALAVHEPWRWLGFAVGGRIDPDGEVFRWVRAVAMALVAGLTMRMVLFPAGALAAVPFGIRAGALAGGVICFFAFGRTLTAGIAGSVGLLVVLKLLLVS